MAIAPYITPDTLRRTAALAAPIMLVFSMYGFFQAFNRRWHAPLDYLLSFIVYWVFWCLLFPFLLLGGIRPILGLFQPFPPFIDLTWQTQILLWWPVIFPLFFVFINRIRRANGKILLVSILLGIIIGLTEEILWRGVYTRIFPNNIWLNLVYPSLMFALWHLAPLSITPNRMPGGRLSFIVYAFLLGVTYTITVYQTGSIAWCTISHIAHDTLGLGGFAYANWLVQPAKKPHINL